MGLKCDQVWRDISDYIDGSLAAPVRAAVDEHIASCPRCTSVLRGTQNVVSLYHDPRMMPLPAAFRAQLRQRLETRVLPQRGTLRGLFVSLAIASAIAALLLVVNSRDRGTPTLRSAMSEPAQRPYSGPVFVTAAGKTFHRAGCPYIHGPERVLSLKEAEAEGYVPCVRCMGDLLKSAVITPQGPPLETELR